MYGLLHIITSFPSKFSFPSNIWLPTCNGTLSTWSWLGHFLEGSHSTSFNTIIITAESKSNNTISHKEAHHAFAQPLPHSDILNFLADVSSNCYFGVLPALPPSHNLASIISDSSSTKLGKINNKFCSISINCQSFPSVCRYYSMLDRPHLECCSSTRIKLGCSVACSKYYNIMPHGVVNHCTKSTHGTMFIYNIAAIGYALLITGAEDQTFPQKPFAACLKHARTYLADNANTLFLSVFGAPSHSCLFLS